MTPQNALSLYGMANPFLSGAALRHSNYSAVVGDDLVRLLDFKRPTGKARIAHEALRQFVGVDDYPCVGARSVFNRETYRYGYYADPASPQCVEGLARDLCAFVAEKPAFAGSFSSFVAAFDDGGYDEDGFDAALWSALSRLSELESGLFAQCPDVSADPDSPRYAFSFCATAFFVVGMHPRSSRLARRFAYPLLVFNPHDQFAELRSDGRWDRFRSIVRARDIGLQGSLNPNLSDFGEVSEARQYSGKPAEERWACPVRRRS